MIEQELGSRARCTGLAGAALLAACGGDSGNVQAAERPEAPARVATARHMIVVVIDTLRADAVGFVSGARELTPVLDELAASGAAFTAVESSSSWTVPATISLLSGLSPFEHGAATRMFEAIPDDVPMLAPMLSERGFHTAAFIANPLMSERIAFERGFDVFVRLERQPAADLVDGALAWAESTFTGEERLHLYLHLYDPHWPYEPAAPEAERFGIEPSALTAGQQIQLAGRMRNGDMAATERLQEWTEWAKGAYDACVSSADRELGRLFEGLERMGISEDALIVVTSDHGEEFGEHGCIGHGRQLHAESLHVPLILAGPGLPRGETVHERAPLRSVLATTLPFLGVEVPERALSVDLLDPEARARAAREPQASVVNVGLWRDGPAQFRTVEFLLGVRRGEDRYFWTFDGDFDAGEGRMAGSASGAGEEGGDFDTDAMRDYLEEQWHAARWAKTIEDAEEARERAAQHRALGYFGDSVEDRR